MELGRPSASGFARLPRASVLGSLPSVVEIAPRIAVDEAVRSGRPVIKGSRVPVDVVLGQLAAGLTPEEVAEEYGLEREDVLAALAYAAKTLGDDEIRSTG